MKYTICGLSQAELVRLGFDSTDAVLISWFADFWHSSAMKRKVFDGKEYGWLLYQYIGRELPILNLNNRNAVCRRFQKYCDSGLMEKYVDKPSGNRTYFRIVPEAWDRLNGSLTTESEVATDDERRPLTTVSDIDSPISDQSISIQREAPTDPKPSEVKAITDRFWLRYGERSGGAKPSYHVSFRKRTQDLIDAHGLERVLEGVEAYFALDWWFTKDRTNGRHTWSFSGFLSHFDELQAGGGRLPPGMSPERAAAAAALMGRRDTA